MWDVGCVAGGFGRKREDELSSGLSTFFSLLRTHAGAVAQQASDHQDFFLLLPTMTELRPWRQALTQLGFAMAFAC